MTLSASSDRALRRTARDYLFASIFFLIFALVYEHFSHGVLTGWFLLMVLSPLLGGALVCFLVRVFRGPAPGRLAGNAWNSGILTITVGAAMSGIFDIYGGSMPDLIPVYWIAGVILLAAGALTYLLQTLSARGRHLAT